MVAHPMSPESDFQWRGWDLPGSWGIELLNGDSQWRAAPWPAVIGSVFNYPLDSWYALLKSTDTTGRSTPAMGSVADYAQRADGGRLRRARRRASGSQVTYPYRRTRRCFDWHRIMCCSTSRLAAMRCATRPRSYRASGAVGVMLRSTHLPLAVGSFSMPKAAVSDGTWVTRFHCRRPRCFGREGRCLLVRPSHCGGTAM